MKAAALRRTLASAASALTLALGIAATWPSAAVAQQSAQTDSVEAIRLKGVTVYEPEALLQFAVARAQRGDGAALAGRIAEEIALIYRQDGYPLAEAVALNDVATGHVVIAVNEGFIGSVVIEGLPPSVTRRVLGYVERLHDEQPLTQRSLERALMFSSDLAGVDITSELDHPDPSAGARLRVGGSVSRGAGAAGVEWIPIRPDHAVRAFATHEFYSLARGGDLLRLIGVGTLERGDDHSITGAAYYRTPVGDAGTYVEAFGGNSVSQRDFTDLNLRSDLRGWNAAVVVGHPIERDLHHFTYLLGEVEYIDARTRFGARRLVSETVSLRGHVIKGVDFDDGSVLRLGLVASVGQRPETPAGSRPDGVEQFAHLRGEFSFVAQVGRENATALRLEARGQWADERLPAVEKFAIGHAPFLRGYAPAEIEGDRGASATVEINHTIETRAGALRSAVPFAFASVGRAEAIDRLPGERPGRSVASIGGGSDFHLSNNVSLGTWVAIPLRDGIETDSGDPAVYASLSVGW